MPTYWGPSNGTGQLRLDVSWTQNVAGNYTDVSASLYYVGQWAASSGSAVGLAMSGNQVAYWTADLSLPTGTTLLTYGTLRHNHEADGTKLASVQGALTMPFIGMSLSVDTGLFSLPTIPRATTPNWSGSFTAGTAKTINLPRASASFTHAVTYTFGSASGTIASNATTSATWTPPLTLLNQIPNAVSGTGTIKVVTKDGSTTVGTKTANFTLTAGSGIVPTVGEVRWDDDNTTVRDNIGVFLQNLSRVKGYVDDASGVYGSTIRTKNVRVSGTLIGEGVPIQPQIAGTITASGEVTDSRGRVGSLSKNFTVVAYSPPSLGTNSWSVDRANSSNVVDSQGTYLRIDLHAEAKSLEVGGIQKNALNVRVFTRPASGGAWVARNVINPGLTHNGAIQVSGGAAFPLSQSFDVKVELRDNTGIAPTIHQTVISTATVTLDMRGVTVGVGKYHERGTLDVAGDGYAVNWMADDDVYAGGAVLCPIGAQMGWTAPKESIPAGWMAEEGQAISRTVYAKYFALVGTTYGDGDGSTTFNIRDKRGRAGVAVSSDTEFNALGKKAGAKTHTLTRAQTPTQSGWRFGWGEGVGTVNVQNAVAIGGATSGNRLYTIQNGAEWMGHSGGGAHNNIQPSIAEYSIVRVI